MGGGFDQPQGSSNTFRDVDLPALAVDASGRLWLAFSQRVTGPNGTYGSRIMLTTLPRGSKAWTAPYVADASAITPAPLPPGDAAPPVWHQFMPSLSFAYGRLMLAYYDTRWDNDILNPAFAAIKGSDFEVVALGWLPAAKGRSRAVRH